MADKTYRDCKDKYLKEKVDTFVVRVPKGKKDEIAEHAKELGLSLNAYVTTLIFADMGMEVTGAKPKKKSTNKEAVQISKQQTTAEPPTEPTDTEQGEEIKKKKMPSFLL